MAIAVYGGQKGGSGKSTHLLNHAVLLMDGGADVLVVDTDEQGSAQEFKNTREDESPDRKALQCVVLQGKGIARQLEALKPRYDHILVDCPGGNTVEMRMALTVADFLVTPCRPAGFDTKTLVAVNNTIEDTRILNPSLKAYVLINYATSSKQFQRREQRLRDFVAEHCPTYGILTSMAPQRLKYYDCADYGLAVHELPSPDKLATAEVQAVFAELWK